MTVSVPDHEGTRPEALHQYWLLDRTPERAAHDLTAIASFICGTPLAVLTPAGVAAGAWGALDHQPLDLTPAQQASLAVLARQAAAHLELQRVAAALAGVMANSKTLPSRVPVCMYCKGLRDDEGCWSRMEDYLRTHTDTELSHRICPACLLIHHPEHAAKR
jgi:hypothetical protein